MLLEVNLVWCPPIPFVSRENDGKMMGITRKSKQKNENRHAVHLPAQRDSWPFVLSGDQWKSGARNPKREKTVVSRLASGGSRRRRECQLLAPACPLLGNAAWTGASGELMRRTRKRTCSCGAAPIRILGGPATAGKSIETKKVRLMQVKAWSCLRLGPVELQHVLDSTDVPRSQDCQSSRLTWKKWQSHN